MSDRVRMKSKTTMNNPLIVSHADAPRADAHTVIDGDEFSTSEVHAQELETLGYAERIPGDAVDLPEAGQRLLGAQTSNNDAIATKRAVKTAPTATVGATAGTQGS